MVTYEFIISSAGAQKAHDPIREALRRKLRAITEPILRQRIQPFVWARYPKAGAVCHSMIRRYLEHERRSHDTHWDIPSYVSVVVSLDSTNLDFEGGFFVTTGNGEKSFIPLQKGDTVVHQSDLLHGVHVVSGERWSWAMWFQDSSDCSSAAENWWQELQLCPLNRMILDNWKWRWCDTIFHMKFVLSGPTHAKPFLPGKRGTDFGTWKAGSCTCQRIKDSSAGFGCAERAAGSVPLPGGSKSVMSETCKCFRTVSFFSGLLPPCARLFLPVPHWINVAVWKLA